MDDARDERRGSVTPARVVVVFAVLLGVTGLGWYGWTTLDEKGVDGVKAAVRDYMAAQRVRQHAEVLAIASEESGVDPYLLAGMMVAESSGRVDAVSAKGALGLFQLATVTAEWRAEKLGLPKPTREDLLSDPLLNARLGADNMAWLLDTYDGDVVRALCAYNAGARKLKNLSDAVGGWEAWRSERERSGNSEILSYAHRVLGYRDEFREQGLFD